MDYKREEILEEVMLGIARLSQFLVVAKKSYISSNDIQKIYDEFKDELQESIDKKEIPEDFRDIAVDLIEFVCTRLPDNEIQIEE